MRSDSIDTVSGRTGFNDLFSGTDTMLFAGVLDDYSTGTGLIDGFRSLGWDVASVPVQMPRYADRLAPSRISKRLGWFQAAYNKAIIATAQRLQPKVMLTVKGVWITPNTLDVLTGMNVRTVNFYPDYKLDYSGLDLATFEKYDLIATTKSFQIQHLKDRYGDSRITFVHHGYVDQIHRKRVAIGQPIDYVWDLAFIGNASPNKARWLDAVATALPKLKMVIAGNGWEAFASPALHPHILGFPVTGDYFARITEHSRINLAVHHADPSTEWADLVSTRSFEIPACGGFMLHVDNAEIRQLYDVPTEIDVFKTHAELCDKINHYLSHEQDRIDIATRGHRRCVPEYSLKNRASQMKIILNNKTGIIDV